MKIRLVPVGELKEFVSAGLRHFHSHLPVTPERAFSQAINPHAQKDDPALLIALDKEDNLVGYLGTLPLRKISTGIKLFGISCWWIDPVKGRGVAMHLFYKMMELTGGNLMFFDLTPHSSELIKALGRFNILPEKEGIHAWFRSALGTRYLKNEKTYAVLYSAFSLTDRIVNIWSGCRLYAWRRSISKYCLPMETSASDSLDEESTRFLDKWAGQHFLARDSAEMNWILSNSWLVKKEKNCKWEAYYAFSWQVNQYEKKCLKFYHAGEMKGFGFITIRDGICKIPLLYVLAGYEDMIGLKLLQWISTSSAHGIICWNKILLKAADNKRFPFLQKKNVIKRMAIAPALLQHIPQDWEAQDGDGDGVFT